MKVTVKRNMLKTLHHKNRFGNYECHIQNEPIFLNKNNLNECSQSQRYLDFCSTAKISLLSFVRHVLITTSEENRVRRLKKKVFGAKPFIPIDS
jgi:hypothetical protein